MSVLLDLLRLWKRPIFPIDSRFFFFKQKTAYEMRISDWSSDVCSSDLDFESSKVVDDATLQIVLTTPYAILDSLLAEYTLGIIPGGEFDPANPVDRKSVV